MVRMRFMGAVQTAAGMPPLIGKLLGAAQHLLLQESKTKDSMDIIKP